jgi:succinate dehydrogenase / fumarate reductase, cytochrome b subunit
MALFSSSFFSFFKKFMGGDKGVSYTQKTRVAPLSPHLQIYRLQITSALSILHRLSELIIYGGVVFFGCFVIFGLQIPSVFGYFLGFIQSWWGKAYVFLWIIGLTYNLLSGIRHMFWDMALGLSLRSIYHTSYGILFLTFGLGILVFWSFIKGWSPLMAIAG